MSTGLRYVATPLKHNSIPSSMLQCLKEFFFLSECAVKICKTLRLYRKSSRSRAFCACGEKNNMHITFLVILCKTSVFCKRLGARLSYVVIRQNAPCVLLPALYSDIEVSGSNKELDLITIPV